MSSIKEQLNDEFNSQMNALNGLDVGTKEYQITVDGVTKMADRIIEIEKYEEESKTNRRDKTIRNVIEGVAKIGGLVLTGTCFVYSMYFEVNGHLHSTEGGRAALRSALRFNK